MVTASWLYSPWVLGEECFMRLIMWVGRAGLVLLACVMALPVQAQGYVADWAEARWQVKSGAFGCSLSHEIPGFGEAVLERNSGQAEVLSLRPRSHKGFPRGLVSLQSLPPAWRADLAGRPLGQQSIAAGEVLRLGGGLLTSVLAELKQGQLVMFSSAGQADGSTLLVSLSPNRFAPAYANFSRCVEQLIPYTFAEIARITLYYQAEAEALNARAKGELDKVARYTKADRQVLGILVDAHSDAREDQTQSLEVAPAGNAGYGLSGGAGHSGGAYHQPLARRPVPGGNQCQRAGAGAESPYHRAFGECRHPPGHGKTHP